MVKLSKEPKPQILIDNAETWTKERMDAVLKELQRLDTGGQPSPEMLKEIGLMTNMMKEMKNGD